MNVRPLLGVCLLAAITLTACQLSPDSKSGEDRDRHLAKAISFGEWDMDALSYPAADRTDWKKVEIPDDGTVRIELQCKSADTSVQMALFDTYGRALDKVQKIRGDSRPLVVSQYIPEGRYFLKLQAVDDSDECEYSLKVSFE
jgi:hypothetical protein